MFDADRPIMKSTQDQLDRATFAKYLARCILDHSDRNSFVIGLYGGWATGKTSILNMMIEELSLASANSLDAEKPIVLNFSPWNYASSGQLIYSFFRHLSSSLSHDSNFRSPMDKRIIHLLELYVSFYTEKPVPRTMRKKRSLRETITFKNKEAIRAWESGIDLSTVKAELNNLLERQKHKIIIVIDNISQVNAKEMLQMFQIIKSMADYSNTVYVLTLDKNQIIKSLDKENHDGKEMIEKIVQLPFEIPPIQQYDLEKILAARLEEVVEMVPYEGWDKEHWADLYYNSLRYFFKNCRDITRYVNTLSFSYPRVKELVNPEDYFALTVLEVFLPKVYARISENKDLFTDLFDKVYEENSEESIKEKERIDEILKYNKRVDKMVLLDLLMRLFPRLMRIYSPDTKFYYSDAVARKNRRICLPDLFEIYFKLSLQATQLSENEFRTILSEADNYENFDQALSRLNQDNRALQFLDRLDGISAMMIPYDNIQNIVSGLIDCGDLFPAGIEGPLSLNTHTRLHHILHNLLTQLKSEDKFVVLQNAYASANKSIYTSIYELEYQGSEHEENADTFLPLEYRDVTPQQLESLQQLCVSRIKLWADNGSLDTHPKLLEILQAWLKWEKTPDCENYVKKLTDKDKGLVNFLKLILAKPIDEASTSYSKNAGWKQYVEDVALFINPASLVEHATSLFEDEYFEKLEERNQLAILIFLDLMNVPTKKFIPKTSGA